MKLWEARLYSKIFANGELIDLERQGFERGEKRGKTMEVDWLVVSLSLKKQMADLEHAINVGLINAPNQGLYNLDEIKRAIADVRNVAGCLFLKMQEMSFPKNSRNRKNEGGKNE